MKPHQRHEVHMPGRWRGEGGFTLPEVMAAMAISLLIAAAGFTAMTSSNKAALANDQAAAVQQPPDAAEAVVGQPGEVSPDGVQGPTAQRRSLGGSCRLLGYLLWGPLAESLEQLLLAVKDAPDGSRHADG